MPVQVGRGKVQGETFKMDLMLLLFPFADRGCDSSKTVMMEMTMEMTSETFKRDSSKTVTMEGLLAYARMQDHWKHIKVSTMMVAFLSTKN